MEEIFKEIKDYENYSISNYGRLRKKTKSGFKYYEGSPSSGYTHTQYAKMNLSNKGKNKTVMAHRLVAEAFIPNPDNKPFVNHKDFNGLNNHVDNLEWVTPSENMQHSADNKDSKREIKLLGDKSGKDSRLYQTFRQYYDQVGKTYNGKLVTGVTYRITSDTLSTKWTAIVVCTKCGAESNILFTKLYSEPTKCMSCARINSLKDLIPTK